MIVFSTQFYVKKELTRNEFIEYVFCWLNNSPHYGFEDIKWDKQEIYEQKCERQKFSMIIANDITAVRLENIDNDNVIWTNDFIYEESLDDKNLLCVRLARDAANKETYVQNRYHRPWLMKTILKNGYGDDDNGLEISDKVIVIDKNNIQVAAEIINGNSSYLLPIVYVTRRFLNNTLILDVDEMAKDLAGTAHVLVEVDTKITLELKKLTNGINPFNGAVHIFYSNKIGKRIIPDTVKDNQNLRYNIVEAVCRRLSLVKFSDKYSWGTIKYQKLLEQYRENEQSSLELEQLSEEILNIKEKESSQLIEELENEINELRIKTQSYEYVLNNMKKKHSNGKIIFDCSENEFFDGEIKDYILEILEQEFKKMKDDLNQKGYRKYHVLQSILRCNNITGKGKKLENELRDIFNNANRIGNKEMKRLNELGFVSKENKHNKLYFKGDDRYLITLGKTPGDYRWNTNAASIAIKTIICKVNS